MKLKYYLRGLGIGIVVTTLILTISFKISSGMSDSDVIDRAKELGMVMQDETEDTLFAETTSEDNKETVDNETTEAVTTDAETTEQETTEQETTEEQTTETPTEAPVEETDPVIYSDIVISPGASSSSVAKSIADAGIVSSQKDFDKYLNDNNFSEKIEVGTFSLNSSMSYYDIAMAITTR